MLNNVQWSQYKAVSCLSFFMALTTATKYCQNTTGLIIVKKQGKVGQHHRRPQEGDVWRGYTPSHWERNFSCIFNHHRHNNEWGPCQPPEAQILDKQRGLHSSKKGSIQWSLTCQLTHCFYAESANQCQQRVSHLWKMNADKTHRPQSWSSATCLAAAAGSLSPSLSADWCAAVAGPPTILSHTHRHSSLNKMAAQVLDWQKKITAQITLCLIKKGPTLKR